MPVLRTALAQVNPTVGDLAGNVDIVLDYARRAKQAGAAMVAFPEMMLTGYPIEDLVFRDSFALASKRALNSLAARLQDADLAELVVIVGYLDADGPTMPGALAERGGGPRNAAAIIYNGQIVAKYFKHHLPNYGVFDEYRHFVPGNRLPVLRLSLPSGDIDLAVVICEDIWQAGGPITSIAQVRANFVVCLNGSPYEQNKDDFRLALCARKASEAGATLAYVNMIGGQDDLVFDGDSLVVSPDGSVLTRAAQFAEQLLLVDLPLPAAISNVTGQLGELVVERTQLKIVAPTAPPLPPVQIAPRITDEAETWEALVLGLRDYVGKNGFRSVILGLSGGIDSALVTVLACDALGPGNVYTVAMPSAYSSGHSLVDAEALAKTTGVHYRVIPIAAMMDAFLTSLPFTGLAEENLQARIRGNILMGLSNSEGHLVLATGNKSEYAVGYSTLYGDSAGGFAPIKDVYKTLVWKLARWRNEVAETRGQILPIPENIIIKPPSAELRPNQLDSDSLPDYKVLDALLARYIDADAGQAALLAEGFDPEIVHRVTRLVDRAEYKRRQSAPGTKITLKAFGRDRRLPMTNKWEALR